MRAIYTPAIFLFFHKKTTTTMNPFLKIFLPVFIFLSFNSLYSQQYRWYTLPNAPVAGARFEDMYFADENTGWIINSDHEYVEIYKTTDGGDSWTDISDSSFVKFARSIGFANVNTGWIGGLGFEDGRIYKTTNGGLNWTDQFTKIADSLYGICGLSVYDENTVFGCGRWFGPATFYKTTNGGINWTIKDMSDYATRLIDCYFTSPDSGFLVGGLGTFSAGKGVVLFTSDGGENWVTRMTTQNPGQWGWKISFPTKDTGYVSLEKSGSVGGIAYFLKTTTGGEQWQELRFHNSPLDEEGIGFVNGNTGWIGGWWFSTYRTTNGGYTWHSDPWGYNVNRFRFFGDTLGYAVGEKVYKYMRDTTIGISSISTEIPERPDLSQNYPNPFNPSTTIQFNVVDYEHAKLTIFDVLGREIAVLVDGKLNPGIYEYKFDASGLESGVYFYKVETFRYTETKKMILLK